MNQENIAFSKNQDKSQTMTDLHILGYNTSFGYEDSYNYYNIDVGKILLFRKRDNEYQVSIWPPCATFFLRVSKISHPLVTLRLECNYNLETAGFEMEN